MLNTAAIGALKARIMDAVAEEAGVILAASNEYVPVDSGALRASGRVTTEGSTVTISYGRDDDGDGAHAPSNTYAVRVHEDMEMAHPHGGQAKFLENAADEAVSGFAAAVAQRVKK